MIADLKNISYAICGQIHCLLNTDCTSLIYVIMHQCNCTKKQDGLALLSITLEGNQDNVSNQSSHKCRQVFI
jgi:hypothetical protein